MDVVKNNGSKTAKAKFSGLLLLVLLLAALSGLSGYLLSKASLVGRTGIHLFYQEYRFLKIWWQGAAVVFLLLLLLLALQGWINRIWQGRKAFVAQLLFAVLALAGLYFTFRDFRDVLSHRLLGERFHLGAYLFWIGWLVISIYHAVQSRRTRPELKAD